MPPGSKSQLKRSQPCEQRHNVAGHLAKWLGRWPCAARKLPLSNVHSLPSPHSPRNKAHKKDKFSTKFQCLFERNLQLWHFRKNCGCLVFRFCPCLPLFLSHRVLKVEFVWPRGIDGTSLQEAKAIFLKVQDVTQQKNEYNVYFIPKKCTYIYILSIMLSWSFKSFYTHSFLARTPQCRWEYHALCSKTVAGASSPRYSWWKQIKLWKSTKSIPDYHDSTIFWYVSKGLNVRNNNLDKSASSLYTEKQAFPPKHLEPGLHIHRTDFLLGKQCGSDSRNHVASVPLNLQMPRDMFYNLYVMMIFKNI